MPERLILTRIGLLAAALLMLGCAAGVAQTLRVDETALRYYAAQGQVKRVEAEARRLARLNPDWSMPEDLWTARLPMGDEGPFWALFSAGDIEGLKRAIAQRQSAEPGWLPSDDLLRKIKRRELRNEILSKAASSKWSLIADLAAEFGKNGPVEDVELAWVVAEAFARTDRKPEAKAIFAAILTRRTDISERHATIQKAIALLPMADVEALFELARNGNTDMSALGIDMTRARMAAVLREERQAPIDTAELAAFEAFATAAQEAAPAGLVAWLALKQDRLEVALNWFKIAITRDRDPMIAHGLALTLLRLGQTREAQEIAFAWREPLAANAILFIDTFAAELTKPSPAPVEPDRLLRYAKVTLESRSAEGAQALGWYAYNSCEFATAVDWFRRATAWQPREASVLGHALSLQRLKRTREFAELVNRYDGLFPTVVGLAFRDGREEVRTESRNPCDRPATAREDGTAGAYSQARVPQPDLAYGQKGAPGALVRTAEFPLAVAMENPLRFPDPAARKTGAEVARPREPEQRQLVARRVSGVTAMPYERFGFALLPGWNGASEPSDSSMIDRAPAQGTIAAQADAAPPVGVVASSASQSVAMRLRR